MFTVWSLEFGVQGQGRTAHAARSTPDGGFGISVQCSVFRLLISWCKVQGAGCRVQGAGCRVQGAGCRVYGAVMRVRI